MKISFFLTLAMNFLLLAVGSRSEAKSFIYQGLVTKHLSCEDDGFNPLGNRSQCQPEALPARRGCSLRVVFDRSGNAYASAFTVLAIDEFHDSEKNTESNKVTEMKIADFKSRPERYYLIQGQRQDKSISMELKMRGPLARRGTQALLAKILVGHKTDSLSNTGELSLEAPGGDELTRRTWAEYDCQIVRSYQEN